MRSRIIKLLLAIVFCVYLTHSSVGASPAYAGEAPSLTAANEVVINRSLTGQKEWEYLEKIDAIDDSQLMKSIDRYTQAVKN